MFNELLADVINAALSAYTVDLKKDMLKMSLFNSNFEMNNLELYKYALLQHDIPIIIERSIVKSIRSYIPWKSLMNDPMVLKISDIMISCKCLCSKDAIFPKPEEIQELKNHQIQAHELFKSKIKSLLNVVSSSFLTNTILGVVAKAKLQIDRMNVRIEFGEKDCFVFGLQFDRMIVDDLKNAKPAKVARAFSISKVAAYIDRNQKPMDCSNNAIFSQLMNNSINTSHDWIMLPCDMGGSLHIRNGKDDIEIVAKTREMTIDLTDWQATFLIDALMNYSRFDSFWKARTVTRPQKNDEPQGFWNFIHRAATKINAKRQNGIGNFPVLFKLFKQYTGLWRGANSPQSRAPALIQMDRVLPYYNIILYRTLAENRNQKTGKITMKALKKVLDEIEFDSQYLIPYIFSKLKMKFRTQLITIRFRTESDPEGIVISTVKPEMSMSPINNGIRVNLSFSSFSVSHKQYVLMESKDMESEDFHVKIELFNENSVTYTRASIDIQANNYVINVPQIFNINLNLDVFAIIQNVLKAVNHPSFKLPPIEFSFKTPPTQVFLKVSDNVDFLLVFDGMTISTPMLTDNDFSATCDISNVSVSFGKKTHHQLVDGMSCKMTVTKKSVDVDVSPMKVFFDWANIDLLLSILPKEMPSFDINKVLDIIKILPKYKINMNMPQTDVFLTLPISKDPLVLSMKDVKLAASVPDLTVKINAGLFTFDDIVYAEDTVIDVVDLYINMHVKGKCAFKFFKFFSILPKDCIKYMPKPMTIPPIPFSFCIDSVDVDTALNEKPFMMRFTPFKGTNNLDLKRVDIDAFIEELNAVDFTIARNIPVESWLSSNNDIFVFIKLGDIAAEINDRVLNFFMSVPLQMNKYFPDDVSLYIDVKVPKVSVKDYAVMKKIDITIKTNNECLLGQLNLSQFELAFATIKTDKMMSVDFELMKREFDIFIGQSEITLDAFSLIKVFAPIILSAKFEIPPPIKAKVNMRPTKMNIVFPHDLLETSLDSFQAELDTSNFSVNASIKGIYAILNGIQMSHIPSIEVVTDEGIHAVIDQMFTDISVWHLLRLIEIVKGFPQIEIPKIDLPFDLSSLVLPPITFEVKNCELRLRPQTAQNYGAKTLNIISNDIKGSFKDFHLDIQAPTHGYVARSWFERDILFSPTNVSITNSTNSKGNFVLNIDVDKPTTVLIGTFVEKSFLELTNIKYLILPELCIANETPLTVSLRSGDLLVNVSPFSSYFSYHTEEPQQSIDILFNNEKETILLSNIGKGKPITACGAVLLLVEHVLHVMPTRKIINYSSMPLLIDDVLIETNQELCLLPTDGRFDIPVSSEEKEKVFRVNFSAETELKNDKFLLVATPKRINEQIIVEIHSAVSLTSKLPFDIELESKHFAATKQPLILSPNERISFDSAETIKNSIITHIRVPNMTRNGKARIDPSTSGSIELALLDGSKVSINCTIKGSKKEKEIVLSCSYAYNYTGIPLLVRSEPVRTDPQESAAIENHIIKSKTYHPSQEDLIILDNADKVFVTLPSVCIWSEVKPTEEPQTIKLHTNEDANYIVPLNIWKSGNEVLISPYAVFTNELSRDITLSLTTDEPITLKPNTSVKATKIIPNISFNVYNKSFLVETIHNQLIVSEDNEIVSVEVKRINGIKHISFSERMKESPYSIRNNSSKTIRFRQSGTNIEYITVEPHTRVHYVLPFYDMKHTLTCKNGDEFLTVNVESPTFQKKAFASGLFYSVNLVLFGGSTVTFTDEEEIPNNDTLFNVRLGIREINGRLKNDIEEFAFISLSKILVSVGVERSGIKLAVGINNAIVVNKLRKAIYRHVIQSTPGVNDNFLKIEAHLSGLVKVDDLRVVIDPFVGCFDLVFLQSFMTLVFKLKESRRAPIIDEKFFSIPVVGDVMKSALLNSFSIAQINPGLMEYLLLQLLPKDVFECICVKHVSISPTKMTISFNPHVETDLPKIMKCIPAIDGAVMEFKKPLLECNSPSSLLEVIKDVSWNDVLKSGLSIMKTSELFGSPASHIRSHFKGNEKTNIITTAKNAVSCGVSIIDTFLCYISNILHIALNTERRPEGNRIVWGALSFSSSIAAAFGALSHIPSGTLRNAGVNILQFFGFLLLSVVDLLFGFFDCAHIALEGEESDEEEDQQAQITRQGSLRGLITITNSSVVIGKEEFKFDFIDDAKLEERTVTLILLSGREVPVEFEDNESAEDFFETVNEHKKDEE